MKVAGLVFLDSTILRRQADPGATFKLIKTIKNKLHFKVPCTITTSVFRSIILYSFKSFHSLETFRIVLSGNNCFKEKSSKNGPKSSDEHVTISKRSNPFIY